MLSLVLALFGTADAQRCGVVLTEASNHRMFSSGGPASYRCSDWLPVSFDYTGQVEVFGRRGCGVVIFDSHTGQQSTLWSNGRRQGRGRKYYFNRKPISDYYMLCSTSDVARAQSTRPSGRRLEQEIPTLQRRLGYGDVGEYPEYDELDGDYDFGGGFALGDDAGFALGFEDDEDSSDDLGQALEWDFGYALGDDDDDSSDDDIIFGDRIIFGDEGDALDWSDEQEDFFSDVGEDLFSDFGEDLFSDFGEDLFSDFGEDLGFDEQEDVNFGSSLGFDDGDLQ